MKYKILSLFLITVMSLMAVAQVGSGAMMVSSSENVVVIIGDQNDQAIQESISTLKENHDNLKVMEFLSFEYIWSSAFNNPENYIFVGHGAEDGVFLEDGSVLSWEEMAIKTSVLSVQNKLYFVNCFSDEIKEFIPEEKIGASFSEQIGAKTAAYVSSIMISAYDGDFVKTKAIFAQFESHVKDLHEGNYVPSFLYQSTTEMATGAIAVAITTAVQAFLIWGMSWVLENVGKTFVNRAIANMADDFANPSIYGAARTVIQGVIGLSAYGYLYIVNNLIWQIYDLTSTSYDAIISAAKSTMHWYDWAIMGASITASLLLMTASYGSSIAAGIVAAAWPIWKVLRVWRYNYDDSNSYWSDYPFSLAWDVLGTW